MADTVYKVSLDDKEILDALKRIDANIDKIAADGQKSFESVQKSASASGLEIGAMAGVVSSLTTEFINLGNQAIGVLEDITKQSIETAIQFDKIKQGFLGIFQGNKQAADEAFNYVQKKGIALGQDLQPLATVFLPKVESLKQFEEIAKIATALQRTTPGAPEGAAIIALGEALTGQFTSLQKRTNIARDDIKKIAEAYKESGIDGLIEGLNQVLTDTGRSFDNTANTAEASFNRVTQAGQVLEGTIGEPIVTALKDLADRGLSFLGTIEDGVFTFNDDVVIAADTVGRAIADIIDFISQIDFGKIDTQTLVKAADYVFRLVKSLEIAGTQVGMFLGAFADLPGVSQALDGLRYEVLHLDDALLTFSQIMALVNADFAGGKAAAESLLGSLKPLTGVYEAAAAAASGDFVKANDLLAGSLAKTSDAIGSALADANEGVDAQKAFNDSLAASAKQIDDYRKAIEDNKKSQNDLKDTLDQQNNSLNTNADNLLAAAAAARKDAEDTQKLEDAQIKVNEEMAKAKKDFQRKLEDFDIATERKRLDIQIEFAQKREDAAKKNLDKLADIRKKKQQDITDAAKDLDRKEEDIARKNAEARIDLEREQRQEQVDIETDYRQKIQAIQQKFLEDADEAENKRDAVAFLRALKERDKAVQNAQVERQQTIQETQITGEQKRQELALQQQRELEEAKIANERKLEDLQTNLERQIEAQNTAYARELEDIATSEQRKNEELNRSRERDIEDAKRAYDRKLEDLRSSLAEELAIIEDFANKKSDLLEKVDNIGGGKVSSTKSTSEDFSIYDSQISNKNKSTKQESKQSVKKPSNQVKSIYGFSSGGSAGAGQDMIVGETGPEVFRPARAGTIVPMARNFVGNTPVQSIDNSRAINQSVGILDPSSITPTMVAIARQVALQVVSEVQ